MEGPGGPVSRRPREKNSLISSLEEEVSILNPASAGEGGREQGAEALVVAESEKSQKPEERLRLLQAETASSSARAANAAGAARGGPDPPGGG